MLLRDCRVLYNINAKFQVSGKLAMHSVVLHSVVLRSIVLQPEGAGAASPKPVLLLLRDCRVLYNINAKFQ